MSKDNPESLSDLKVGEVYPAKLLVALSIDVCGSSIYIDNAVVVKTYEEGKKYADRQVYAIFDRRKESE